MVEFGGAVVQLPSGREMEVGELVAGWTAHVQRIVSEAVRPQRRDDWGADDFVGALYLRDFVQLGLGTAGRESIGELEKVVSETDRMYREMTTDDDRHVVASFAGHLVADAGWWWHRLPMTGSIRAELLDWATKLDR
ncbi:hypothetical protein ACFSEO_13980 [Agromyces cerinus subsp. nitratus]